MHRTQYVKSGDAALAYQLLSEAGPPFLQVPGAVSNLALEDTSPFQARYYERLTRFASVVRFDKRGTGLSDRGPSLMSIEQQVADIDVILRDAGLERVTLCGLSHGGSLALLYAAEYPERVEKLILIDAIICDAADPFRPMSDENWFVSEQVFDMIEHDFEAFIEWFARAAFPNLPPRRLRELMAYMQATANPAMYASIFRGIQGLDLRPLLPALRMPTLVIHAGDDRLVPAAHGRYAAEHIPDAQYVEPRSTAHIPWFDDVVEGEVVAAIEQFVTGTVRHNADSVVASILFTDIVDSTAQQHALGNEAWSRVRQQFETDSQACVQRFGGRVVQFTGDGVMAAFVTPGQALRAAHALVAAAHELGIELRAGIHAGEAYQIGSALSGTCVNLAARVSAEAGPGEILTTEAVRGMVEGAGFQFADAGERDLKGLGARRLLRLT